MGRILYVEDHEIFGAHVKNTILARHHVDWVTSLDAARAIWDRATTPYDAILCDYDLPDGKGREFVEWVRSAMSEEPEDYIPIIAVSAHDAGNQALIAAGADVICAKFDVTSSLLQTVEEVLAW